MGRSGRKRMCFVVNLHILLPQINFGATFSRLADSELDVQRQDAAELLKILVLDGMENIHFVPAANSWHGYEYALSVYAMQSCMEWRKRGHRDELTPHLAKLVLDNDISHEFRMPPWVGNLDIHRAHRAELLRRNDKYARMWPGTDASLPMLYPVLSPNHIDGYYLEDDKSGVQ